jgi:hypothetical protein
VIASAATRKQLRDSSYETAATGQQLRDSSLPWKLVADAPCGYRVR